MAQRNSEYARLPDDHYVTPKSVWDLLYKVEPWAVIAFDCAVRQVDEWMRTTLGRAPGDYDFLTDWEVTQDIATNPPYGRLAEKFVRHALDLRPMLNIAFLLPATWDCAKTRVELFHDRRFSCKYILTQRISWANLKHTASPSTNHAWYVWYKTLRRHRRPDMEWI